jgi:hypothetical protein
VQLGQIVAHTVEAVLSLAEKTEAHTAVEMQESLGAHLSELE